MADYTVPDVFNKEKALSRVKFGRGAALLDIELDELQKIGQERDEKSNRTIVTDGFFAKPNMSLSGGTLTVPLDTVFLEGKVIEILEPMTLAGLTTGDKVYLSVWEDVVASTSPVKKGGNESGGTTINNLDTVDASHGEETARRVQQKVQLTKTNADTAKKYMLLATLTGATTFTDNRSKIAVNVQTLPGGIVQDSANRFMTDAERTKLTGIATGATNYTHPATHPPSIIATDASNRFISDAEKTKLAGIESGANNYSHPATHPATIIVEDTTHRFVTDTEKTSWNGKETTTGAQAKADAALTSANTYSDGKATTLLGGAPVVLDNLKKVATSLNNDPAFSATMTTELGKKETPTGAQAKVDTHAGNTTLHVTSGERTAWNAKAETSVATTSANGLMASTDKSKLDGVAPSANNYVHPATHPASIVVQDSSNRFATDAEKATWNAKAPTTVATTSANGLMASADKTKLDGVAAGANAYSHPATHPATMITEDATHRFATDTEKATWNGKETTTGAQTKVDAHANLKDNPHNVTTEQVNVIVAKAATVTPDSYPTGVTIFHINTEMGYPSTLGTVVTHYVNSARAYQIFYSKSGYVSTRSADTALPNGWTDFLQQENIEGSQAKVNVHAGDTVKHITATERTTWNGKAETDLATSSANGLMPATDKAKLDGFTVATAAAANVVLKLNSSSKLPASITGSADGNAATATKLATARTITLAGDVTGSVSFDGTGNVSITTAYKNSGVVAGTYAKMTVDAKGNITGGTVLVATDIPNLDWSKITTGKPTTVAGYGITDAVPTPKKSATLPNIAGWYRIAQSELDVSRPHGTFVVDWTMSGYHGRAVIGASILYGVDPVLNQLHYAQYITGGLSKARIVYTSSYLGDYAYLEVYNEGANAISLDVTLADSNEKWLLITPIAGAIPVGYSTLELTFNEGLATTGQVSSQVATGTAPIIVNSTTVVPNLNADMLDGAHAGTAANNVLKLDSTGKASPDIITEDSSHRFATDAEKVTWNAKETTTGAQARANTALASAKTYAQNASTTETMEDPNITTESYIYTAHGNGPEQGNVSYHIQTYFAGHKAQVAFANGRVFTRSFFSGGSWTAWIETAEKAGRAWVAPTFTNGWSNAYAGNAVFYSKNGDYLNIKGSVTGGTIALPCFTLPVGFRPAYPKTLIAATLGSSSSTNTHNRVTIDTDGKVTVVLPSAAYAVVLDFTVPLY